MSNSRLDSVADALERVLDKGVVIVGDIAVTVVDVELLNLRMRPFIAYARTAREMGVDQWADLFFSPNSIARAAEVSEPEWQHLDDPERTAEPGDLA